MFALQSRRLRSQQDDGPTSFGLDGSPSSPRLSAPTSGSARRRARERKRAEQTRAEGERLARERREQRAMEKLEQQRIAREQLASYEPWGRAGGGAPNPRGIRYTKIRDTGIYPEDELRGVSTYEPCRRWPSPHRTSPRRRRRRTPLRLREDPQLLYADTLRKSVDNDVRYRRTPEQQRSYREVLDDLVHKRNRQLKDEMRRDLEHERKMQTLDGPWGRPGPGGTTWRNPRDIGLNFAKSMGWTDDEIFGKMKRDHKRQKRSSLTLPQVKKDDDAKEADSTDKENIKPTCVEKLPDIKQTSSPKERKTEETKTDENQNNKIETTKNGKNNKKDIRKGNSNNGKNKRSLPKAKFVKRLPNGERLERIVPDDQLHRFSGLMNKDAVNNGDGNGEENGESENKLTPEATILKLTGGIELVPLLARRRRVGAPTLPSSDVTRPPEQACQWREILQMDYLRDLKHQMQVKYERKLKSREDSAESVRRHHDTWASLWGKPGHGAPLRGKYARSNLAHLLYVPPLANPAL